MNIKMYLRDKIMGVSRSQKENQFYSLFKEGMTVLDVGVSSETLDRRIKMENHFLKHFKYESQHYIGLGIQDMKNLKELYPGKRFVQYSGGIFPFQDKAFDWVFSNAVIEHVGCKIVQLEFLNEMLRVADNIFFTTPNKYFLFETHTYIPFLHWSDTFFYLLCRNHKRLNWVTRDTLNLFSFNRLKRLLNSSNASNYRIYKNRFLRVPMTFTVICSKW